MKVTVHAEWLTDGRDPPGMCSSAVSLVKQPKDLVWSSAQSSRLEPNMQEMSGTSAGSPLTGVTLQFWVSSAV